MGRESARLPTGFSVKFERFEVEAMGLADAPYGTTVWLSEMRIKFGI